MEQLKCKPGSMKCFPVSKNSLEQTAEQQDEVVGTEFLRDFPAAHRRGNHDSVGWRVIAREREPTFQPPFGGYDKDYPGWQPGRRDPEN